MNDNWERVLIQSLQRLKEFVEEKDVFTKKDFNLPEHETANKISLNLREMFENDK